MMLHLGCFNPLVLVPKAGFKTMAISAPSILFPQTKFLFCATALRDILKIFSNLNDSVIRWFCGIVGSCPAAEAGSVDVCQESSSALPPTLSCAHLSLPSCP